MLLFLSNLKRNHSNYQSPNIKIEKLGKSTKLSDNNGNKIVFLHNAFSSKILEVTIKITNLVGIISLGVGLKDKLKLKAYKFESNSVSK